MHAATYFDDWRVQNGELTLMYSKHQQQHLLQPSIAQQCVVALFKHTPTRRNPNYNIFFRN